MRNILLNAALLLLCFTNVNAQISLVQSSYPASVIGTDSLKVTTVASAFPSLAPQTNGLWDMSVVTDSIPIQYAYRVPASGYQFADSNQYSFSTFGYQGNVLSEMSSTGLFQHGINVDTAKFSLTFLTTGLVDSFVINAQNMAYSSPREKIAFPATFSSSWSSAYQSDLTFLLTFLLNGDTLSPGIVRTYKSEKDTVIGWGKMRVKDATGAPSVYMNVLQVQTTIIKTDSFFIKGAPMSMVQLAVFNVTQGQKDTVYQQNYYREQEVTPLVQVDFRDAGFTQPYKAVTHVQRLQAVGVENKVLAQEIKVFPNPVNGKKVYVEIPKKVGLWSYDMADVVGAMIIKGNFNKSGNEIVVPTSAMPGVYYLRIYSDENLVATEKIEIN